MIMKNDNELNNIDKNKSPSAKNGKVIWFYGLSGSGKSTIADRLAEILISSRKLAVYRLDGDVLRTGLNSDLGFSERDRVENIRRAAEVAKILADEGFVVIASLITPQRTMRDLARDIIGAEKFVGIYVKASLETCENRDPKGLYKKMRKGEIKSFTGVDSPFEEPADNALVIETELLDIEAAVQMTLRTCEL